jgi:hypothetical protein
MVAPGKGSPVSFSVMTPFTWILWAIKSADKLVTNRKSKSLLMTYRDLGVTENKYNFYLD